MTKTKTMQAQNLFRYMSFKKRIIPQKKPLEQSSFNFEITF